MKNLRVIDEHGNKQDFETDHVPRIGERIVLVFGRGGEPVSEHRYRVKDVAYRLDNSAEHQAAIHIVSEDMPDSWPD